MNWVSGERNSNERTNIMTNSQLCKLFTWLRCGYIGYQIKLRTGVYNYKMQKIINQTFISFLYKTMSQIEHKKGKLTPIQTSPLSIEEWCKEKVSWNLESYYENYTEKFLDEHSRKYVVLNWVLYSVDGSDIDEEWDIAIITKNADWTLDYHLRYYNWWTYFEEMLEYALEKMDEEKKDTSK